MTASHSDEWTPRDAMILEEWRMDLAASLQAELSLGTTVEFLTYHDSRLNRLIRFVNIYDGLTKTRVEVLYPEPIEAVIARVLEAINEHAHRPSKGTGRPQVSED